MVIRERVPHPCYEDGRPLVGATVILYDDKGVAVGQTVTDSDGYFTFTGLPSGRYFTSIDYPSCDPSVSDLLLSVTAGSTKPPFLSASLSSQPSVSPMATGLSSLVPSFPPSVASPPTMMPSLASSNFPTLSPTASPTKGQTFRSRVSNPCVDIDEPLVGALALLYDSRGRLVDQSNTDEDGYYEFSGLPIGRYFVQVQFEECPLFSRISHPTDAPSYHPTDSPSPSTRSVPASMQMTALTSFSIEANLHPSQGPSLSSDESSPPSMLSMPITESSYAPTSPPVNGMIIRHQVYDPCDSSSVLVGAVVILHNDAGEYVGKTLTDSEGYYIFTGLPLGRYRSEVDYPECEGRHLSKTDYEFQSFIANGHAFKFYKNGEVCDVKLSIRGEDELSTGASVHFDTLDECCANMFWFDIDGCSTRSPVAFQFEFCVDISGFGEYPDCPLNEIQTVEGEMQKGIGQNSTLALVQFGSTMLSKVGDEIKCIDPTDHHNLMTNKLRGRITLQEDKLTICGVVVTKETSCSNEACLRDMYDKVLGPFESHIYSTTFSSSLHSSAGDGLQMAKVVASSLTTRKIVFPSTVPNEDKSAATYEHSANNKDTPRFYPTYIFGTLCHSKTLFDSWEQSYPSLKGCCEAHFSWDLAACCSSLNMGGC
jgi:hypothetical protein